MSDFFDETANFIPDDVALFIEKHVYLKGHEQTFYDLVKTIQTEVFDKYQRRLNQFHEKEKKEKRSIEKKRLSKIQKLEKQKNTENDTDFIEAIQNKIQKLRTKKPVSQKGNKKQTLAPLVANALKDFWLYELEYERFIYTGHGKPEDAKPLTVQLSRCCRRKPAVLLPD